MKTTLKIAFLLFAASFTCFAQNYTTLTREQLVGTWEQVDSTGNSVMKNDLVQYKIITPQTFTVVGIYKSKGLLLGIFMGEYELDNMMYIEKLDYAFMNGTRMVGTKNLFYTALNNDILYISGIDNPYKQYWKKIDKLPEATIKDESTIGKSKPTNVEYSGGDGSSIKEAVIIKARNESEGVAAEYNYIAKVYGMKNVDWKVVSQSSNTKKKKKYDIIAITLIKTDKETNVYFDITDFFGK